jgi:hypothetical protein
MGPPRGLSFFLNEGTAKEYGKLKGPFPMILCEPQNKG